MDLNSISAYIRKQGEVLQELRNRVSEFENLVRRINSNQAYVSFKEKTIREARKTAVMYYAGEAAFIGAGTQRTPIVFQIDPRGWFFTERVHCAFRPTAGVHAGCWRPLSHDDSNIAAASTLAAAFLGGAEAPVPDVFNFYWEYAEGSSQLMRMNMAIPGAYLYRKDRDGMLPGSDGWPPATSITFYVTPLAAAHANAGVFNVTFEGVQCFNTDI